MKTIARARRRSPMFVLNIRKLKRTGKLLCVILALCGILIFGAIFAGSYVSADIWSNVSSFLLGFDAADLGSIVRSEIPIVGAVNSTNIVIAAHSGDLPSELDVESGVEPAERIHAPLPVFFNNGRNRPAPDAFRTELGYGEYPIETIVAAQVGRVFINNETALVAEVDELLNRPLDFDMSVDGPAVLIIHTHTTEAFAQQGRNWYHISDNKRSHVEAENVVRIGEEFARIFEENGINVVHSRVIHDYPSFRGAYRAALTTIEEYRERYPSIQFVIDIHRDALIRECNTKLRLVSEIGGNDVAQIMFVVGTNAGGLEHDGWRDNLALAVQLQQRVLDEFPGLMRSINLRRERFNHHAAAGSMLLEVGTSGNSMNEAILAARHFAPIMAEMLLEM